MERVIALVDMDCFYVQVEQRLQPETKGIPCAVVQYKTWKGGGIIAVGYEARAVGVTRNMWGDDAKAKCPNIHFFRVPEVRGKADLTKYREAGAEVIAVLSKFSDFVERASIDEAYIDLTQEVKNRISSMEGTNSTSLPNTFIVGWGDKKNGTERENGVNTWLKSVLNSGSQQDKNLLVGAVICEEMRAAVYQETGFQCSAGIAHNKMLAKLVCGLHKPNKQTVLPHASIQQLFDDLPLTKVRNLGGKLGQQVMEQLRIEKMGEICRFDLKQLQQCFGDKTGCWLYDVCRGIEREPVSARQLPKSIGCSKNFPGKTCLNTREKVKFWLKELSKEVEERLIKDKEMNKRTAKSMTVSIRYMSSPQPVVASRACALTKYDAEKFASDAHALILKFNKAPVHQMAWSPPIICLGISATKFQHEKNQPRLQSFSKQGNEGPSQQIQIASQYPNQQQQINSHNIQKRNIASFFTKPKSKENEVLESTQEAGQQGEISSAFLKSCLPNSNAVCKFTPVSTECNDQCNQECTRLSTESKEDDFLNQTKSQCVKQKNIGFFASKYNYYDPILSSKEDDVNCLKTKPDCKEISTQSGNGVLCQANMKVPFQEGMNDKYTSNLTFNTVDKDVLNCLPDEIRQEVLKEMEKNTTKVCPFESTSDERDSTINTFFQKKSVLDSKIGGELLTQSEGVLKSCHKCGSQVRETLMDQHLDFHYAKELQREITWSSQTHTAKTNKKRSLDSHSPSKSNKKSKTMRNTQTISKFFNKSS